MLLVRSKFPEKDEQFLSLEEVPLSETWEAMLEAKKQGLVNTSVSNFSSTKLENLRKETTEMPEMNQLNCIRIYNKTIF